MSDVDHPRAAGVESLAGLDRPLDGHVFGAEGAWRAGGVVVGAAAGVDITAVGGRDAVREQEVHPGQRRRRLLRDRPRGVTGQCERAAGHRVPHPNAVTQHRWMLNGDEFDLQSAGLERLERRLRTDADSLQVVVAVTHRRRHGAVSDGVDLVGGVHRRRTAGEQPVGVAQAVEMVEVDVGDHHGVGQGDVAGEKLPAQVGTRVDEQRLPSVGVVDVDGEARAFDAGLAGPLASVTLTPGDRRPGGVAGAEQRDLHSVVVVRGVVVVVPVVVATVGAALAGVTADVAAGDEGVVVALDHVHVLEVVTLLEVLDGSDKIPLGEVSALLGERPEYRLPEHHPQVTTRESLSRLGDDTGIELVDVHLASDDAEDVLSHPLVGLGEVDHLVETPPRRRVELVGVVRGRDQQHVVLDERDVVDRLQQGVHRPLEGGVFVRAASLRDEVELVDKEDAGRQPLCHLEGLLDVLRGLAEVL